MLWNKQLMKVNSLGFVGVLIGVGLLFLALPKERISEGEKRKLAPMPQMSMKSLMSGKLADSLDAYYSDNFVWRNDLIDLANKIKDYRGIRDEEIRLYTKPKAKQKLAQRSQTANKKADSTAITKKDSTFATADKIEPPTERQDYENIKSVIVFNKKAVQVFGGVNKVAAQFAAMVKSYKKELGANVKIYCMAIPSGSDFYLPYRFNKSGLKEKASINYLYSILDSSIVRVRAYEELDKHKDEYIQFNTDHHWTGRGAYYAYTTFCNAAGFEYLTMESMQRKVIRNFVGSLYYYTLSDELKSNPDSVEYFKIPNKTKAYYFKEGITKSSPTTLYVEYAKGGNAYGVFLGMDFPLMRVESGIKNGRKILQIKDSYGNAFAPFLAAHYEEVFILDYRYFNGKVKDIVKQYGITDIIFTHNIFAINSDYTAKRENALLK